MVDEAGGRSQISQLTTSVIVLLVLLFFTRALSFMPNAVLSTVVFIIGVKLVDLKGMSSILSQRRAEFWLASLTAAIVVVVGVEQGIILAMLLSILVHLRHSYRPTDLVLVPDVGNTLRFAPLDSGGQVKPGVVAYHFGASLYFANAASFSEEVLKLVADTTPPVEVLLLDFSAVGDIDFSAAYMLRKLLEALQEKNVDVLLMNVTSPVSVEMQSSGLTTLIGAENIFEDAAGAMTALEKLTS
jgi:SulP family sulfate permease